MSKQEQLEWGTERGGGPWSFIDQCGRETPLYSRKWALERVRGSSAEPSQVTDDSGQNLHNHRPLPTGTPHDVYSVYTHWCCAIVTDRCGVFVEKGFLNIDEIWNDDSVGKKTTFLPHESPLLLI